jgi:hypothetical protein
MLIRVQIAGSGDQISTGSADCETAETNNLEWVTHGYPLFEAIRRHSFAKAQETKLSLANLESFVLCL